MHIGGGGGKQSEKKDVFDSNPSIDKIKSRRCVNEIHGSVDYPDPFFCFCTAGPFSDPHPR